MLRTFFAVKIEPTPGLRRIHARLSSLGDRFHPLALDNLHVTLKFLGDTPEAQVSEICALAKPVIEGRSAMHAQLSGLGAFPNARRPSIVWVGLAGSETLGEIAGDLDRALVPLNFVPEARAFQPHLTLLRVKSRPPDELFSLLSEESAADFGMIPVKAIEFLQSELTPRGSRYTKLATFALAAPPLTSAASCKSLPGCPPPT